MFPDMRHAYYISLDELAEIIPILKQLTSPFYSDLERITKKDGVYTVVFGNEGGHVVREFKIKDGKPVDVVTISSMMH